MRTGGAPSHERERMLVLHLRPSRRKARELAIAEVLALLRDCDARAAAGGPLSEEGGVSWIAVAAAAVDGGVARLRRLGYVVAVDLVSEPDRERSHRGARIVRWKGRSVMLSRVYEEPEQSSRNSTPDRREFLLECDDGVVRAISGYRGGRGPLQHRALPVEDARMLVNLAAGAGARVLLDPFAGAGGVVLEAKARGLSVLSMDVDPALRFGLSRYADLHAVGDASSMPFASGSIDAVASEPPYHSSARQIVSAAITEIARVIRPGGRAALLLAREQAEDARTAAAKSGLALVLDSPVDRKGISVRCLCWRRESIPAQTAVSGGSGLGETPHQDSQALKLSAASRAIQR